MEREKLRSESAGGEGDTPKGDYERCESTRGCLARHHRNALMPKTKEDRAVKGMKRFQESVRSSNEQFMSIIREQRQADYPELTYVSIHAFNITSQVMSKDDPQV